MYSYFFLISHLLSAQTSEDTFITRWEITNDKDNIIIYSNGDYTYNYTLKWEMEDKPFINGEVTDHGKHIIENLAEGRYKVTISGEFPHFISGGMNEDKKNAAKLLSVEQWGSQRWKSMHNTFAYAYGLTSFSNDTPNLKEVKDMSRMFAGAENFNGDLSDWDVSKVRDMSWMFSGASSFNGDLSDWDVSKVTNMSSMFSGASSFNGDLSNWNVSRVTNMSWMFSGASSFNSDLSKWDVRSVTNMGVMFQAADSFNGDLSDWDVRSVTNMSWMFNLASKFTSDLSDWDVSSVRDMSNMFSNASSFNSDLSDWDVSKVRDMSRMFNNSGMSVGNYDATLIGWSELSSIPSKITLGALGLKYCAASSAREKLKEKKWNIERDKEDCSGTFFITRWEITNDKDNIIIYTNGNYTYNYTLKWEMEGEPSIKDGNLSTDGEVTAHGKRIIENLAKGKYKVTISGEFPHFLAGGHDYNPDSNNAAKLLSVEQWGTQQWKSMSKTFRSATNLTSFGNDTPNLQEVTDMSYMFNGASKFNSDLSKWDVSRVTNMSFMFSEASKFNSDLSDWDVSSVRDMSWMFQVANSFNGDLSDWDVSSVINMSWMFYGASSFNSDLSNWNVSSVTDMYSMFSGARKFTGNLSKWNISNVENMKEMFNNSGMSIADYDATLIGWSELSSIPSDITLGAKGLKYCAASSAREKLKEKNWNFVGDSKLGDNFVLEDKKIVYNGKSHSIEVTPAPTAPLEVTYQIYDSSNNVVNEAINVGVYRIEAKINGCVNEAILEITPASLKVEADAMTKTYGDADPLPFTYKVSGLQHSDTENQVLYGALSREQGENVGTYVIEQGTLLANGNIL
ncbi:BspA family leucine-rich repeat surface protein [Myroides injenensis]|uniref:BspA family leucine-rich repeat surface protein n=1 Tax=Myroides injenensis TaxID=1183151 RepID=UPI000288E058|nr:BspA family leucine-rich repeat surface protein [Myroides injenensis]